MTTALTTLTLALGTLLLCCGEPFNLSVPVCHIRFLSQGWTKPYFWVKNFLFFFYLQSKLVTGASQSLPFFSYRDSFVFLCKPCLFWMMGKHLYPTSTAHCGISVQLFSTSSTSGRQRWVCSQSPTLAPLGFWGCVQPLCNQGSSLDWNPPAELPGLGMASLNLNLNSEPLILEIHTSVPTAGHTAAVCVTADSRSSPGQSSLQCLWKAVYFLSGGCFSIITEISPIMLEKLLQPQMFFKLVCFLTLCMPFKFKDSLKEGKKILL